VEEQTNFPLEQIAAAAAAAVVVVTGIADIVVVGVVELHRRMADSHRRVQQRQHLMDRRRKAQQMPAKQRREALAPGRLESQEEPNNPDWEHCSKRGHQMSLRVTDPGTDFPVVEAGNIRTAVAVGHGGTRSVEEMAERIGQAEDMHCSCCSLLPVPVER